VSVPVLLFRRNNHLYKFQLPTRALTPQAKGLTANHSLRYFTVSWPFVFYSAPEDQGSSGSGPRHVWFGKILAQGGIPGDCPDYPHTGYGACVTWFIVS
jgi:hypothetical protein